MLMYLEVGECLFYIIIIYHPFIYLSIYLSPFPGYSVVKDLPACTEDVSLIPGLGRSPGEIMATHSSILAWKIPWTEEPSKLQSMGSQRVEHDLVTEHACTATYYLCDV